MIRYQGVLQVLEERDKYALATYILGIIGLGGPSLFISFAEAVLFMIHAETAYIKNHHGPVCLHAKSHYRHEWAFPDALRVCNLKSNRNFRHLYCYLISWYSRPKWFRTQLRPYSLARCVFSITTKGTNRTIVIKRLSCGRSPFS